MGRLHGGSQFCLELEGECIEPGVLIANFTERLYEPCELSAANIFILRMRKLRLDMLPR